MGLLSRWFESLDYEYNILSTCTRHKSPHSTCKKCLDVCKEEAITLVKQKPVITREKCVECGNCIVACPVQAVAGIFPNRKVIHNKLIVTPGHKPTVKELLMLYKKGVKGLISEDPSKLESWHQAINEANSILHKLDEEPLIITNEAFEKREELYSRRELLSLWKKDGTSLIKQVTPAAWRFNHKDLDVTKYYPGYQFAKIFVKIEKCTLCKACEALCEKKCFSITESSLSIVAQACSSCQLCVDICPEKAIQFKEEISEVKDIQYPIYKKQCSVCKQPFETLREHEEQCVYCTKQKEHFS